MGDRFTHDAERDCPVLALRRRILASVSGSRRRLKGMV